MNAGFFQLIQELKPGERWSRPADAANMAVERLESGRLQFTARLMSSRVTAPFDETIESAADVHRAILKWIDDQWDEHNRGSE